MIDDATPQTISEFPNATEELSVALQAFKIGMERSLGVCFPACVYSYDRSTHTAEVMPLIKMAYFDGEYRYIRRKPYKVTVRNIQCGGVTIDFPVYIGDTGWVISSDRDTTLIKQPGVLTSSVLSGNRDIKIVEDDYQAKPHQPVLHGFSYGFFIPDNWGLWESWRYKDNPTLAIGDAIYLGNSFDTKEDKPSSDGKKFQSGNEYEKKASSSLVITKDGAISMASSKPKEEETRATIETSGGNVKVAVSNDKTQQNAQIVLDAESGITIRQDDESAKTATICNISPKQTTFTMVSGGSSIQIFLADGKLNISTSGSINIAASSDINLKAKGDLNVASTGDVNVNTLGDARVAAQGKASITASGAAMVNAGGDVDVAAGNNANISAAKNTNINGGENVNIAGASKINVASKDAVNIVTAGNTTVMSKKEGSKILVTTLSRESNIDVVAEGKNSKVAVTLQEESSELAFTTEKKKSPITITTKDESSPINIVAEKKSNIAITAGSGAALTLSGGGSSISLQGGMTTLEGSKLKFLGKEIYLEDPKNGNNVKYKT